MLANVNIGNVRDTGATMRTIRTSGGQTPSAAAVIQRGTGTSIPTPTDYALTSPASETTTRSVAMMTDKSRITLTATASGSGTELGIQQGIFDTGGTSRTFLLARVLRSVSSGNAISWAIDFLQPWLYNMAVIMFGIMSNANVSLTDMSGASFTARVLGALPASGATIALSPTSITWSPGLYSIPDLFDTSTTHILDSQPPYIVHYAHGSVVPPSTVQIRTIALYQQIFDTAGVARNTLLLAIPLTDPITLEPNKTNMIILRIAIM